MARIFVLIIAALVWSTPGLAQQKFMLGLTALYTDDERKADSATSSRTRTIYSASFGADVSQGFYLGAKYYVYGEDWGGDDDEDYEVSSLGGSLGYLHKSGFFLIGSYLFNPEKEVGSITYKSGDGLMAEVGYLFHNSSWAAGPQITYTSINYDEVEIDGDATSLSGTYEDTSIYPHAALYIFF